MTNTRPQRSSPTTWIGKAVKQIGTRIFYEACKYKDETYHVYDCVLLSDNTTQPYPIARIISLYEQSKKKWVKLEWFFRGNDLLRLFRQTKRVNENGQKSALQQVVQKSMKRKSKPEELFCSNLVDSDYTSKLHCKCFVYHYTALKKAKTEIKQIAKTKTKTLFFFQKLFDHNNFKFTAKKEFEKPNYVSMISYTPKERTQRTFMALPRSHDDKILPELNGKSSSSSRPSRKRKKPAASLESQEYFPATKTIPRKRRKTLRSRDSAKNGKSTDNGTRSSTRRASTSTAMQLDDFSSGDPNSTIKDQVYRTVNRSSQEELYTVVKTQMQRVENLVRKTAGVLEKRIKDMNWDMHARIDYIEQELTGSNNSKYEVQLRAPARRPGRPRKHPKAATPNT